MKRDMDLIRKIVLELQRDDRDESIDKIEGVPPAIFNYHVQLLHEAGLVSGVDKPKHLGIPMHGVLFQLTWEGQDFADSIKDQSLWDKAKKQVIDPVGGWTFSILKRVIASEIEKRLLGLF